jgi:flagellar biosynthesis GTPase FlhF
MTEKKRAWQVPQNWVIALLLLGIAGYFAIHYLHKPKVNRLQQATAYFDALEAQERAEREHQAALQAQQQATAERLAAQQAQQAAAQARQQAEEANRQVAQAQQQADQAKASAQAAQQRQQQAYAQNGRQWMLQSTENCTEVDGVDYPRYFCNVICVNGNGQTQTRKRVMTWYQSGVGWIGYRDDATGSYSSQTAFYQAVCAAL